VKSQRAEENRAYVRGLLWQRQPGFAAALALAEQRALCPVSQCARPDQDDGGNDEISGRLLLVVRQLAGTPVSGCGLREMQRS
jgi:hypothetical protein